MKQTEKAALLGLTRHDIPVGLAKTVYLYTVYDRIFGDSPAKNTVYTPYIYMVLANPRYSAE